ncbi:hypothetical protein Patl1_24770 [Pistacia atlantica]|uniref:Uncharacterized protein n=1 Tax=Pistacia atlantica TaxID=434234 RepID=A0ACC1B0C0_9ROSI|nr:hypothetical protein Patl1_24770 [Pistacia atlantica]
MLQESFATGTAILDKYAEQREHLKSAAQADSRRMYSWWWDSHISPKNSKWLQENLTDMDAKVKQMIKVIEEDADSFARRAEMYYKKRPELMKLVEEFYRGIRALAKRYDHATGALTAHRTMAKHFPTKSHLLWVMMGIPVHLRWVQHVHWLTLMSCKMILWDSLHLISMR